MRFSATCGMGTRKRTKLRDASFEGLRQRRRNKDMIFTWKKTIELSAPDNWVQKIKNGLSRHRKRVTA